MLWQPKTFLETQIVAGSKGVGSDSFLSLQQLAVRARRGIQSCIQSRSLTLPVFSAAVSLGLTFINLWNKGDTL